MTPKQASYESVITEWVKWFRSVNDPETHQKVGERHVAMLWAAKYISRYEIVREGSLQVPRVILHVRDAGALQQLEWALPNMFPRVPFEVLVDEEGATMADLPTFLKDMGETRTRKRKQR